MMPSCAFQHCTSTWVLFAKYFKHKMLPHPQSVAKTGSTLPAFQRECQLRSSAFPNQTDNLSLRCFSRKSKNHCILSPDWCLHCYIMVGGDRGCAFKSRSKAVIYSDLPLAHILCPAVPFKTAPALECFLPNISSTLCFPIRRALLRLVAHCLPCRESASWEAQPFPTKPTI